jgi:predicted ATPase
MNNCYVLTGAPGSGKTAILRELVGLGFTGISEPAREVLAEQCSGNGNGVPEKNPRLFCSLMLSIAVAQFRRMSGGGAPVFFDRGIPDSIAYARLFGLDASAEESAARANRYNERVFMTPSWPSIYVVDEERNESAGSAHRAEVPD